MSSWTQSARAFHKLQEIQKSSHDRTVLGFSNSESSEGETSTQSQPVYDKFNKMGFVKADVIYDCCESIRYDDQKSSQSSHEEKGKDVIGYQRPESSKPSWLKNRLDKDKAKAGSNEGETSTQSQPVYDKFNKMGFVKADVIYDCCESIRYDDQTSSQSSHEGKRKDGIGYQRPESSKPSWLKNGLDKDKAKAGSKSYVPNQQWRNFRKAKYGKKTWPRRDPVGQNVKSKLHRSHNFSQTFVDPKTRKTVKVIQVWVPKGGEHRCLHQRYRWKAIQQETAMLTSASGHMIARNSTAYCFVEEHPCCYSGRRCSFPTCKNSVCETVNTYIATNTTIDAREEQRMVGEATEKRKSKSTKKSSSADNTPIKVISEVAGSKKRVATEDIAPVIPTKRRTVKTKHSSAQASLDIMPVAQDVVPIQVIDPTPAAAAIKSPALKRKSRKRRLVLTTGSDDETMGQQELVKDTDKAAAKTYDEVDIIIEQVLEETLMLGVNEEEHGGQGVDDTMFIEDFAQWLDDFVSSNSAPEIVGAKTITEVAGSTSPVVVKDMNRAVSSIFTNEELMSIDYLLLQISDDMLLPSITATEITNIQLGESVSITEDRERDVHLTSLPRISTHDKGKAILEEDEPIRGNPARELVELIYGDIEFLIRIRDQVMVDVVEFFHSFSLNTLSNFDALLALKAKEKLMLEWAETDSLAMAVKRKGYILAKYRELLLRSFLESHRKFLAPGQPWTATPSLIIDLLSDAHSYLWRIYWHSSVRMDYQWNNHAPPQPLTFLLIAGPNFWKSGWNLSLFLNQKKMPKPAIEDIFALHISLVEPVQYWEPAPYLIKTWRWAQVCADIVRYYMFGCLKPVRVLPCTDITVYNLGVERIPADFLSMFAQGMACHSFVDSVVQRDSGDLQEVDVTGDEEVDLVSSDVSTVYRSPSPIFQEVGSVEHDLRFALGPATFPSVAQDERLYFVQSPVSSPATYQPQESSSPSTDVSMHFDSMDVPLNAQADTQASAPVDFSMFTDALEDLRSSISQRIHDSNCEILSKVNAVEVGVREALFKQHVLLRQSLQDACRVLERQGIAQEMQINDLKKGLLASVATVFQDLMAIKKGQREQDANIPAMDSQIAAIRNEQLYFQAKIAAYFLSLSTQIGDITDYIRSGDAKKGEIGSISRRPPPIRVERRPLPTPSNLGESSSSHGRVISVEEAAEMVREADRQTDRREREREREKRLRRLRRRGH
ncbi:hypothetical protein F511_31288 [Dorcoceras hygrometricum]|uniref:Uncharacterized protein n=1 Tax=Dorcoceras hygrometricum TaxID=472368 RepID=A0A2Z7DFX0_9LAMI|nr:hypothetical protein F511_31288 [Dorcoceras hygrometricum]